MNANWHSGRQVVVTGIGVISPIGIGCDEFRRRLLAGEGGISRITIFPYLASPGNAGAEVREFNDQTARSTFLRKQRKSIKVMCREIQLGVASATQALEDSQLQPDQVDHERFGVEFGANLMFTPPASLLDACLACTNGDGQFHGEMWATHGLENLEPLWLLKYLPNMPACHIGILADAQGPSNSLTLEEASGNLVIAEARGVIRRHAADVMFAGATGTRVHPLKSIHAALSGEFSPSNGPPERRCRPFDRNRSGQVIGEGACTFLLEEREHAERRGAKIYATILGTGGSCVVRRDGRPDPRRAMANAIRSALRDAGLQPEDIGHVNAHGAATKQSDIDEALALRDALGDYALKVPVTALKSYFGNAGSGCGSLELAGSLLCLQQGVVPPTLNFETPDPECPLSVVHGEPLPVDNRVVLKINVTRTGQAAAVIARVE